MPVCQICAIFSSTHSSCHADLSTFCPVKSNEVRLLASLNFNISFNDVHTPPSATMNKLVPPTTIERYFSLHYGVNLARQIASATGAVQSSQERNAYGEDTCVARHHNGVCVICVSPQHPIVRLGKKVSQVDYRVEMREVKGKRKRGGIVVEERTKLCTLTCETGDVYSVQCAVKGTILEYNTALQERPNLISIKPLTNGYLGVVLPWPSKIKTAVNGLMGAEEYAKVCSSSEIS